MSSFERWAGMDRLRLRRSWRARFLVWWAGASWRGRWQ